MNQLEVQEGQRVATNDLPSKASMEQCLTPIQEFFSGCSVLVTGATGFMGKVLLEKLLRSCPGLRTIYTIVRPKKGHSAEQRIQDLANDYVFSLLSQDQWRRLVPLSGDVAQPGLGLSKEDRARLCEDVVVVFHLVATVRFDEPLRVATSTNVQGTMEVLRLCRDMPKLRAVVHMSTAFSQFVRHRVEERFYDSPVTANELLALCDALQPGEEHDHELASRLLGGYPNTYVFTKAVTEALINEEFSDLPIAVIRPAIVTSTNMEPYPGWIDNIYGPVGFMLAAYLGVMRVLQCDQTTLANFVPCDMSANCAIAVAWDLATNRHIHGRRLLVYNHVSSCDSPLTWNQCRSHNLARAWELPTVQAVWHMSLRFTPNRLLYLFWRTILHHVPALIVDISCILIGKNPMLSRSYRKIHRLTDVCSPFITRNWDFDNTQAKALWARLSSEDRQLFPFDMRDFDWSQYFQHYVRGIRHHLLKEELDTLPAAKIRQSRLLWLHRAVITLIYLLHMFIVWRVVNPVASVIMRR